eukprot:RCo042223
MDLDEEPHVLVRELERLQALPHTGPQAAELVRAYEQILASDLKDEQAVRVKEQAIYQLGDLLVEQANAPALNQLLRTVRPFFALIPKAKTAKIVRKLFDLVGHENLRNTLEEQITVCEESIEWSRQEKRTFLRHRLQSRLADLFFQKGAFQQALSTLTALLREVRRLDDKQLLVEVQLLESRVYHALKNLSKAKAALVASRTAANAIYCPPLQQAHLDSMSGVLHAQEKDFKTAFSYFYEAFETHHSLEALCPAAKKALKYMLLCRIMSGNVDDVTNILSSKNVLHYSGREIDAMKAIAAAYKARNLHEFERVRAEYDHELAADPIVASHLLELYDALLEQHLTRVIEPYRQVDLPHVAKKVKLELATVEAKLSQMILDKKLNGTIDQTNACLIIFEGDARDTSYEAALQTVENMTKVVDALMAKWEGKFEKILEEEKKEEEKKKEKEKEKKAEPQPPSASSGS